MHVFFEIIIVILRAYMLILFARVVLSWFRISPGGRWFRPYKFLVDITEPLLIIFRKVVPLIRIGGSYLDLSYIAAILVVQLLVVLLRFVAYRYL